MLRTQIEEARHLLEANNARKPLLDAANEWRAFIRLGDLYLESIHKVVDAANRASEAEDELTARRAVSDVSSSLRSVVGVTGKAYGHFKTGREALYELAKLYEISTKTGGTSYGKKPTPLEMLDDKKLRDDLKKSATGMDKGIQYMLNKGAGLSRSLRMAAKQNEDVPAEFAEALVKDGLDFRDEVSINVFARTNGIMRRAAELSKRSWELMMMEDSKLGWKPPWVSDPELGNVEIV
jgi:hypothetical protein